MHLIFRTSSLNILYPKIKGHVDSPAGIICFQSHHLVQLEALRGNSYLPHTGVKQQIISHLGHWKNLVPPVPERDALDLILLPQIKNNTSTKKTTLLSVEQFPIL